MPRFLVKARLKHYWERAKEKVRNIPTYFKERKRVRALDADIGTYRQRWARRVLIENGLKRQIAEFAKRNNLSLKYASFTRLKTSRSSLEKIDRIKKQLREAIPIIEVSGINCYALDFESLTEALTPKDATGRVPLDESDLQQLYYAGKFSPLLPKGIPKKEIYKRIVKALRGKKGGPKPVVYIPVPEVERIVAEDRVALEATGIRIVLKDVSFHDRKRIPPRVMVFERRLKGPTFLQDVGGQFERDERGNERLVLNKESIERNGSSLESIVELMEREGWHIDKQSGKDDIVFRRKHAKINPVGEGDSELDFFQRRGIKDIKGAYSQVAGNETYVVPFTDANRQKLGQFSKVMAEEGWTRNVREEDLMDVLYAFIDAAVRKKMSPTKYSDYIKRPKVYGFRGIHLLVEAEKGKYELQLRTPRIDEEVRGIDSARGYHKKMQKRYLAEHPEPKIG